MIVSKKVLKKIKEIIEKHHAHVLVGLGLSQGGKSVIEEIYDYNFKHEHGKKKPVKDKVPEHYLVKQSKDHLSDSLEELLEKQKALVLSQILGNIREANNNYKFDAQNNLAEVDKDKSLKQLATTIKDLSKDAHRNWERVINTEMSNAISMGSVDRIVEDSENPDETYVYRIVVQDSALCKYCRRFYLDRDGSPKVYKLSTLLSNGSNYGKKASAWKPVAMATHPNERCSQVIELKPGWKVQPGGSVTFIGEDKWAEYISKKSQS